MEKQNEEAFSQQARPEAPAQAPTPEAKRGGKIASFLQACVPTPKKPKTYLDVLKIIAIYMVLWNHTSNGFELYNEVLELPAHLIYMSVSILIKIAVPLFFMTSGALLLGREESYQKLYRHRVLRFGLTLLAVSAVSYLAFEQKKASFSLVDFLTRFYTGSIITPLWYLYSYIAFLVMLPFIRKLAKTMEEKDYLCLLLTHLAVQLLGVADFLLFNNQQYHSQYIFFFTNYTYVMYSLLGYYIDKVMSKKRMNADTMLLLMMLSVMSIGATFLLTDYKAELTGVWQPGSTQSFFNTFIVLPSITVFFGAKMWFTAHPASPRAAQILSIISSCTFGTYLFEKVWRDQAWFAFAWTSPWLGRFGGSLAHILVACVMGIGATFLWKLAVGGVKLLLARVQPSHSGKKMIAHT